MTDPLAAIRSARDCIRHSIIQLTLEEARLTRVLEQLELGQQHQGELELDPPLTLVPAPRTPRARRIAWTADEDQLLIKSWKKGAVGVEIPGRTKAAIVNRACMLGLTRPAKRPFRLPPAKQSEPAEPAPKEDDRSPSAQVRPCPPSSSKPRLTFEEQLALVESGRARLTQVVRIPSPPPSMTLGGVVGPIA